jgi:hypothetical protein
LSAPPTPIRAQRRRSPLPHSPKLAQPPSHRRHTHSPRLCAAQTTRA